MIDGCKCSGWKDGFLASNDRRVVLNHREQRRRALLCSEKAICAPVEVCNDATELWHGRHGETTVLRHAVEKFRLVETAHDQHPLNDFAQSGNLEFAASVDSYRNNIKIKMRSCPAIEAKLVEKRVAPQSQG